jgi:hypothetical protein
MHLKIFSSESFKSIYCKNTRFQDIQDNQQSNNVIKVSEAAH